MLSEPTPSIHEFVKWHKSTTNVPHRYGYEADDIKYHENQDLTEYYWAKSIMKPVFTDDAYLWDGREFVHSHGYKYEC